MMDLIELRIIDFLCRVLQKSDTMGLWYMVELDKCDKRTRWPKSLQLISICLFSLCLHGVKQIVANMLQ